MPPARLPHKAGFVAVLVERRYLTHDQPAGMCAQLRGRGRDVRVIDTEVAFEAGDCAWLDAAEVIVPRGRSSELLSLLRAAEHRGIPTINTAAGIAAAQNKPRLAARLEEGGVSVAETAVATAAAGRARAAPDGRVMLVAAGRRVWAAGPDSRAFTELRARSFASNDPADGLRAIAERCGRLLGLRLFGVVSLLSPSGARVADVLDFPEYGRIPGASEVLATEIIGSLHHRG